MSQTLTRRAALIGALASSTALALPALAAIEAGPAEGTYERVRRLQLELSGALADLAAEHGHHYVSEVKAQGTARHARALIDRNVYEDAQARLARLGQIEMAVQEWQRAVEIKAAAADAYCGPNAPKYHLPIDHPLRSAWIDADDAATRSQWKLLNLLSDPVA